MGKPVARREGLVVKLLYNPENDSLPFFFSLDTPVGKGYPHARADDVTLVQYYFVVSCEVETGETLAVVRLSDASR